MFAAEISICQSSFAVGNSAKCESGVLRAAHTEGIKLKALCFELFVRKHGSTKRRLNICLIEAEMYGENIK